MQERQQRGAEKAAELEEKLKDKVLYNQRDYVDRVNTTTESHEAAGCQTHVYTAFGSSEEKPHPTQPRS